jgi:hypothetical protein
MRKTIWQYLTAQAELTTMIPVDRWYQAGAVVDRPNYKPFVVVRWISPVPSAVMTGKFFKQLRVDVHDQRGSYQKIDAFLGSEHTNTGLYKALSPLVQYVGVDGRITEATFLGHSGDQEDETYNTNMKFSSWRLIGVDL